MPISKPPVPDEKMKTSETHLQNAISILSSSLNEGERESLCHGGTITLTLPNMSSPLLTARLDTTGGGLTIRFLLQTA